MTNADFQFERDALRRRVAVTLSTKVTVDVWWASVSALMAEEPWPDPVVYDMSTVESAPLLLNLPNLVGVVEGLIHDHGARPVAVVVSEGDLPVWQQRLAALFSSLLPIAAFSSVTAAHEWLDRIDGTRESR
jgi:hypothetical protein